MSSATDKLFAKLASMKDCPCCGASLINFETYDPEVHGFSAEAFFNCGARVQLCPDRVSQLQAANGCPNPLVSMLDLIEEGIEEEDDDDPLDAAE